MSDQEKTNDEPVEKRGNVKPLVIYRINDAGTGWEPVDLDAEFDELIKSQILAKPKLMDIDRCLEILIGAAHFQRR
ncbi:MAG: hypothetical protein WC289_05820 [Patescibacteria group bacterium]